MFLRAFPTRLRVSSRGKEESQPEVRSISRSRFLISAVLFDGG